MTKLKVDSDLIRELAAILEETGLTEIEINDNGQGVRIAKGGAVAQIASAVPDSGPNTEIRGSEVVLQR